MADQAHNQAFPGERTIHQGMQIPEGNACSDLHPRAVDEHQTIRENYPGLDNQEQFDADSADQTANELAD